MDHCEACVTIRRRREHAAEMRRWVREERAKVHAKYMASLGVFDSVYARPHKFSMLEAVDALATANER